MRGKIRDKSVKGKSAAFHSEEVERRRPYKRDARPMIWRSQEVEDDDYEIELDEGAEDDEEQERPIEVPGKK